MLMILAIVNMSKQKLSTTRDELTESCSAILLGYRNKCTPASRATQVLLFFVVIAMDIDPNV